VIEAASNPAAEAWANIKAINSVCRRIVAASDKTVIAAYTGSAGAGGVMMALGADVVVARSGVVLNPYYDIGLYGSELHTYSLPARVGRDHSRRLLAERLPIDGASGRSLGLVDEVGPRDSAAFGLWLAELAAERADPATWRAAVEAKAHRVRRSGRPLSYYESRELAEMARDMFDDRSGFAEARHSFVHKRRPTATPARLAVHRHVA
jgi:putative two-component system protein, hydrogenase maturation factor HypX/HoxX